MKKKQNQTKTQTKQKQQKQKIQFSLGLGFQSSIIIFFFSPFESPNCDKYCHISKKDSFIFNNFF